MYNLVSFTVLAAQGLLIPKNMSELINFNTQYCQSEAMLCDTNFLSFSIHQLQGYMFPLPLAMRLTRPMCSRGRTMTRVHRVGIRSSCCEWVIFYDQNPAPNAARIRGGGMHFSHKVTTLPPFKFPRVPCGL